MRKLDVRSYKVSVTFPEGKQTKEYDVKSSLESVLLASGPVTEQRLSIVDLLRNARVAEKINAAVDFVLLEETEYQVLKQSFDVYRGFGQFEVELCRRVMSAVSVEVEVKE